QKLPVLAESLVGEYVLDDGEFAGLHRHRTLVLPDGKPRRLLPVARAQPDVAGEAELPVVLNEEYSGLLALHHVHHDAADGFQHRVEVEAGAEQRGDLVQRAKLVGTPAAALVEAGVLQGDGGGGGDRLQQAKLVRRVGIDAIEVAHRHHADHVTLGDDGHARVAPDRRHGWPDAKTRRLLLYVVQQERTAGTDHVVGKPVAGRPRERSARLAFLVDQREM